MTEDADLNCILKDTTVATLSEHCTIQKVAFQEMKSKALESLEIVHGK